MDGVVRTARRGLAGLAGIALLGLAGAASAADYPPGLDGPPSSPAPRYFPRGEGAEPPGDIGPGRLHAARLPCAPRRAPSDAWDDPSYVGSPYGLGKPSYYGFRPPLGVDDPFGRPLRGCP